MFSYQGVTDEDIKTIVDKHNFYRKDPKAGETAAMMCKMVSSDTNHPFLKKKAKNKYAFK